MPARALAIVAMAALMVVGLGTIPVASAAIPATDWPVFAIQSTPSDGSD